MIIILAYIHLILTVFTIGILLGKKKYDELLLTLIVIMVFTLPIDGRVIGWW